MSRLIFEEGFIASWRGVGGGGASGGIPGPKIPRSFETNDPLHFNLAALNLLIFFSFPSSPIIGGGVISSP